MTLKEYLKDPSDYDIGVKFYDKHFGAGKWQRKTFGMHVPRILHKNLLYQLKKLIDKGINISIESAPVQIPIAITPKRSVKKKDPKPKIVKAPVVPHIIYTPDVAGKELQARDLYRSAGKAREGLFSPDKEVRKVTALFIKSAMKQNRTLWAEINYFREHGSWPTADHLPEGVDLSSYSLPELISMFKNLGPWLSKEKKKIEKETDPDKKKNRIANYARELSRFEAVKIKLNESEEIK